MKVRELMKVLEGHDPEMDVLVEHEDGWIYAISYARVAEVDESGHEVDEFSSTKGTECLVFTLVQ